MKKRAVIVGGGYAGVTLARALDAAFDVVLLERKDRFYHNVGAIRAYADASWFPRLFLPYDRVLRRGRVVQDEAVEVLPGGVRTRSGEVWEADVAVVATGSGYAAPFKCGSASSQAFLQDAARMSSQVEAAGSVAILGGGPVGVELAGELSWRYPDKRVVLAARGHRLLEGAENPRLGLRLLELLRRRGVEVRLGDTDGDRVDAEVVVRAYGVDRAVPCLGSDGPVRVNGRFEVPARPGVYAIGDAADCGEAPLTFLAKRQARYLAKLLQGQIQSNYSPVKHSGLAVPMGPKDGAVELPLPGAPVLGGWLTTRLKGKDLFLKRNREMLGQR